EPNGSPLQLGAEVFEYETTHDLVPSFATFFVRHLERALARGLRSAYVETEDRLHAIRGRVDIAATARTGGRALPVPCRFDEFSPDTQLNRIVLGATERLARLPGVAF